MGFTWRVTARFYEIDRAGIVFFARFYEYAHAAYEELMAEMFGSAEAMFSTFLFAMPLVHTEADYRRPVFMGDRLRVDVSLERLGRTSVTFRYRITGDEDGEERCTVRLVHAFVDRERFTPIEVPAVFHEALARVGMEKE